MVNAQTIQKDWSMFAPTVLRVALGVVFAVHGYQKLFVQGFDGVAGFFAGLGIPAAMFFAYIVTLLEFVGGILLILGVLVRGVAVLLVVDMLVATLLVHLPNGFSVSDGGYEFTFVLLFGALSLLLSGAGSLALQSLFGRSKEVQSEIR